MTFDAFGEEHTRVREVLVIRMVRVVTLQCHQIRDEHSLHTSRPLLRYISTRPGKNG